MSQLSHEVQHLTQETSLVRRGREGGREEERRGGGGREGGREEEEEEEEGGREGRGREGKEEKEAGKMWERGGRRVSRWRMDVGEGWGVMKEGVRR